MRRLLVPVTGSFAGRLRVRRSTGHLDAEGVDRVLSMASRRALSLALQLGDEVEVTAVHIDKGAGEDILREALAHGAAHGLLIEGGDEQAAPDAAVRAATLADVYRQNGPFDAVIGPASSDFSGFTGALAAMAGGLDLPCVHGAHSIALADGGFSIGYSSMFGDYDLRIPRPCVVLAGDVPVVHADAWNIARAYEQGILRLRASQFQATAARTRRLRIEQERPAETRPEQVDAATLVRRLRSRALVGERP